MAAHTSWVPCFNSHPETNRACQRRAEHVGPHRCGYPGGVDVWTGTGWLRGAPTTREKANDMFYILSLKWTREGDAWMTFWRPDCAGYVWALRSGQRGVAGTYRAAEIMGNLPCFNDGDSNLAVRCSLVNALSVPIPAGVQDYPDARGVPFTTENLARLKDSSPSPITVRV